MPLILLIVLRPRMVQEVAASIPRWVRVLKGPTYEFLVQIQPFVREITGYSKPTPPNTPQLQVKNHLMHARCCGQHPALMDEAAAAKLVRVRDVYVDHMWKLVFEGWAGDPPIAEVLRLPLPHN